MRRIAAVIATLMLGACAPTHPQAGTTTPTTAPALDCSAPSGVQKLVCGDPQLTDLDHRLQTAYQQALARPGADRAALTTAQNDWVTLRDACAQNAEARTC